MLGNAWLTEADNPGQVGYATFALVAQSDQSHADRIRERFQLYGELFRLTCHKYIKISLYIWPNSVARIVGYVPSMDAIAAHGDVVHKQAGDIDGIE